MLVEPQGDFTVTDNFDLNSFGEIGLAAGTTPLRQPTDVAPPLDSTPGADNSAYNAVVADNAARRVTLDDGSSMNFLERGEQVDPAAVPDPRRRRSASERRRTFTKPVIVDYRNSAVEVPADVAADRRTTPTPCSPRRSRTPATPQPAGRRRRRHGSPASTCSTTSPRPATTMSPAGGPARSSPTVTATRSRSTTAGRPGRAARPTTSTSQRQQDKIVNAINALDAERRVARGDRELGEVQRRPRRRAGDSRRRAERRRANRRSGPSSRRRPRLATNPTRTSSGPRSSTNRRRRASWAVSDR